MRGFAASMKINDFPVAISIHHAPHSQRCRCRVNLAADATAEVRDAVRRILGDYSLACNLGMFGDGGREREPFGVGVLEVSSSGDALAFELTFNNVRTVTCRVLVRMFRAEIVLDGSVTGVDIASEAGASGHPEVLRDEQQLPLPGIVQHLSFRYDRQEPVRNADRGIRVTFAHPLDDDRVTQLARIQAAWQAVGEGGCCPNGVEAVECGMLCHSGVMIAPHIFEMKIAIFRNPELCFDYFANVLERFSTSEVRVERMEVW
jgi:hypothetical protein